MKLTMGNKRTRTTRGALRIPEFVSIDTPSWTALPNSQLGFLRAIVSAAVPVACQRRRRYHSCQQGRCFAEPGAVLVMKTMVIFLGATIPITSGIDSWQGPYKCLVFRPTSPNLQRG